MKTKKVNIKDIARLAEVSITTVSQVLNGKPMRISEEKRNLIIAIAKEEGYRANQVAKSLVTKETKTIGLIIPDIENAFFSSLAKAVEDAARKEGYLVLLMNSGDAHDQHMKVMDLLFSRQIDGLLMTVPNESYEASRQSELEEGLLKTQTPVVLVDRPMDLRGCDLVYFDNERGGYIATRHLIQQGYREIACITGPKGSINSDMRLEGYKKALIEFGIDYDPKRVVEGDYHFASGKCGVNTLIQEGVEFDAIFAFNDIMAFGAKELLMHIGIHNMGLMGYDYVYLSKILGERFNSVAQNSTLLGARAFELLLDRMMGRGGAEKVTLCLSPKLVTGNGSHGGSAY